MMQHLNSIPTKLTTLVWKFSWSFTCIFLSFLHADDTALFHGLKSFNDVLLQAGPNGNVYSEMIFQKDSTFTLEQGWAFPRKVYFDGDECVMPFPDSYPFLPNLANANPILLSTLACILLPIFLTLLS